MSALLWMVIVWALFLMLTYLEHRNSRRPWRESQPRNS